MDSKLDDVGQVGLVSSLDSKPDVVQVKLWSGLDSKLYDVDGVRHRFGLYA